MSTAAVAIVLAWNVGLLVALWMLATRLHEDVQIGVTPASEIARQWSLGMGLFVALMSPWPQSVVIAAVCLCVYVTWGAMLDRGGDSGPMPQPLPRETWEHVSGGTQQQQREP